MATSSSTSAIFNGNSRYSTDFQAVIERAAAIASLPISQLKAQKTDLSDQSTALASLDGKFAALQTAVDGIGRALGGSSFQASASDSSKLSVTLGDGATEGNYSIEVVSAGAYATSMSTAGWVAAPGNPHPYKLSLNGHTYSVFALDNSAGAVAGAINSQFGDKVRATVVNVGSASIPNYRISLQATTLGDSQPDLLDGNTSLQTQQTLGAQAHYIVNGSGVDVLSNTRTVTIAEGITLNLLAADGGTPTNIAISRSTSALSNALETFAAAYNSAVDEVDKQHGTSPGALAGQSLVSGLSRVLSRISTYSSGGSQLGGLNSLGLDLDKTGHLTFNAFALLGADLTDSSGVAAFLGTASGGGFLKSVTDSLASVEQVGSGLIATAKDGVAAQSARIDASIVDQQGVVDRMKTQMQERLAAVDALIATMEQQYNYLSGLFESQQTAARQFG